jgi:hypothetical protein
MRSSIYNQRPESFRTGLAARSIGLCPRCLTHDAAPRCSKCRSLLVDQDGNPITSAEVRVPVAVRAPVPPRKVAVDNNPYLDGTGPECSNYSAMGPCEQYYVSGGRGRCRLAGAFNPSKCRIVGMISKKLGVA